MCSFIPALNCFIFTASKLLSKEGGLELPFKLVINCLQRKKEGGGNQRAKPFEMFPLQTGAERTAEALADCHWEVSSWGRVAPWAS